MARKKRNVMINVLVRAFIDDIMIYELTASLAKWSTNTFMLMSSVKMISPPL